MLRLEHRSWTPSTFVISLSGAGRTETELRFSDLMADPLKRMLETSRMVRLMGKANPAIGRAETPVALVAEFDTVIAKHQRTSIVTASLRRHSLFFTKQNSTAYSPGLLY